MPGSVSDICLSPVMFYLWLYLQGRRDDFRFCGVLVNGLVEERASSGLLVCGSYFNRGGVRLILVER